MLFFTYTGVYALFQWFTHLFGVCVHWVISSASEKILNCALQNRIVDSVHRYYFVHVQMIIFATLIVSVLLSSSKQRGSSTSVLH